MRIAGPLFIALLALMAVPLRANDHATCTPVLSQVVDARGFVDYDALLADRTGFDRYVEFIENTGPATDPSKFPDSDSKLAFYINSYNALVFKGVLDRGPERTSVWNGSISGYNFFQRMKVKIDGQVTNLQAIEDVMIRESFADPRVHAALNCASVSCPRLPQTAFTAADLDTQLNVAMREFVNEIQNVRIDKSIRTVYLSRIFDWCEDDFLEFEERSGANAQSLLNYINRFRAQGQEIPGKYKVRYLDYDKGINHQRRD